MNDLTDKQKSLNPEEIWERVQTVLRQCTSDLSAATEIPALAGFFDTLTIVERDFIAGAMIATLSELFSRRRKFEGLHFAILALVEPYLNQSNYQTEARIQIGSEFRKFRTGEREFNEYHALGLALASLNYRSADSSDEWKDFYQKYFDDAVNCYDAFDLALAGTSTSDIGSFAALIREAPVEPWVIQRLMSFFPTLVQCHASRDVEQLVIEFLKRVQLDETKKDLIELAKQYGLKIRLEGSVLIAMPPAWQIPSELAFAHGLILNEEQRGVQSSQLRTALERKSITVITSGYSGIPIIQDFQTEFLDLIEELNGRQHVVAMESPAFAQLPPESSGRRKIVFAFPTYLTAAKQDMGYSVRSFGLQHRVGVLYPAGNRLRGVDKRPKTLSALLMEVRRNNGQVICLQNYAISEIVRQEAEKDPKLELYFNDAHLILRPATIDRKTILPIPRMPQNDNRHIVFVYDLAGHRFIQERIKAQKKSQSARNGWLLGATTDILSHSLSIPVGVGFTKYLVKWLVEGDNWRHIDDFVESWSKRTDFQKALSALGVDPYVGPRPVSGVDHTMARIARPL